MLHTQYGVTCKQNQIKRIPYSIANWSAFKKKNNFYFGILQKLSTKKLKSFPSHNIISH